MNSARLISVTRERWGVELPKSLSALTNALLPKNGERERYWFTGKMRPNLQSNDVLVFRFEGKLLGEGSFSGWNEEDDECMIYRPIRQYRERVVGSEFFKAGHNPYPILHDATIRAIRKAALKLTSGPYPKTGEKESVTTHRIGQGLVREAALERYETRCCLCRIDEPGLLVAGHIRSTTACSEEVSSLWIREPSKSAFRSGCHKARQSRFNSLRRSFVSRRIVHRRDNSSAGIERMSLKSRTCAMFVIERQPTKAPEPTPGAVASRSPCGNSECRRPTPMRPRCVKGR